MGLAQLLARRIIAERDVGLQLHIRIVLLHRPARSRFVFVLLHFLAVLGLIDRELFFAVTRLGFLFDDLHLCARLGIDTHRGLVLIQLVCLVAITLRPLIVAHLHLGLGSQIVGGHEIGIMFDGDIHVLQCFGPLHKLHTDQAAIVVQFVRLGRECNGFVVFAQRAVVVAHLLQQQGSVVMALDIVWGDLHRLVIVVQCRLIVVPLIGHDYAIDIVARPFRAVLNGFAQIEEGLVFVVLHQVQRTHD